MASGLIFRGIMMKKILIKNIAKFCGVTPAALQKWKRPLTAEDGVKYLPPTGKHNLFYGCRIITYLFDNTDKDFTNYVLIRDNVNYLKYFVEKHDKNDKTAQEAVEVLQEFVDFLEDI